MSKRAYGRKIEFWFVRGRRHRNKEDLDIKLRKHTHAREHFDYFSFFFESVQHVQR